MQRSLTKSIVTLFAVAIVTLVALLFAVFLPADSTPAYAAEPVEGTTTTEQVSNASGVMDADALKAAVENGGEVVLGGDIKANVVIPKNVSVTIDLNGYTLTDNGDHTIINNGTLTVEDSSTDKTGKVDNVTHGKAAIYNEVGATFTLASGTLDRTKEAGTSSSSSGDNSYYTLLNHGTAYINGGTIQQGGLEVGKYSSLVENGWYDGSKNTEKKPSIMTVNGGTFLGGLNSIKNDDYGELNIIYATVKNVAQAALLNWNVATIKGGSFSTDGGSAVILNGYINDTMDKGELTITGGEFTTNGGDFPLIARMDGSKPTGGVITVTVTSTNADLVAAAINVPGVTTYVKEGDAVTEMSVSDLAGLKEALNTETVKKITLACDITSDESLFFERDVTLDMNGYELTVAKTTTYEQNGKTYTYHPVVIDKANVTIVNGNITVGKGVYANLNAILVTNRATLTLGTKSDETVVEDDRVFVTTNSGYGIVVSGGAALNMYGGSVTAKWSALGTNNTTGTAAFNVYGATLKSTDDSAIFMSCYTDVYLKDTAVIGKTAIDIRIGNLTVDGGSITSTYDGYHEMTYDEVTASGTLTGGDGSAILVKANYYYDKANNSNEVSIKISETTEIKGAVTIYDLDGVGNMLPNDKVVDQTEALQTFVDSLKNSHASVETHFYDVALPAGGSEDGTIVNVDKVFVADNESVTATVSSLDELRAAFAEKKIGKIVIGADFEISGNRIEIGDINDPNAATRSITLDLNGHTLKIGTIRVSDTDSSANTAALYLGYNVSLTLTDTVDTGIIDASGANDLTVPIGAMRDGSTLIVERGTIIVDTDRESCVFAMGGGKIVIKGGTFINNCTSDYAYGGGKPLTVNIANNSASTIDISGGTFKGRNPMSGDDNTDVAFVSKDSKVVEYKSGNMEVVAQNSEVTGDDVVAVYTYADNETGDTVATVYTEDALRAALADKNYDTVVLGADIGNASETFVIDRPVTLDLNGYTLENKNTTSGNYLLIEGGNSEAENIKVTIRNGNISSGDAAVFVMGYADVVMENVSVKTDGRYGLELYGECDQSVTAEGCTFEGDTSGVAVFGAEKTGMTAAFSATDCTIKGGDYGVSGNGTYHLTTIDIVDSKVSSDRGTAIYHPQVGTLTISGGSEISGISGIEMRAGTLTITGGTITATGEFAADPNGNGATTSGVAVAMMQHTTERDLTLNITGGEFNGAYAVYQQNIQNNDSGTLTMSLTGGTFNGNVDSENCTEYISGGQYSVKPAAEAFGPGFDGVEYDGYYVVIKTTADDIAALLAARIDAQADVRTYAAVLGIDWKAMEALADTDDVAAAALDAYNAIGNATSEGYVAIARSAAMDALDAYAAAMAESELEAAKLKAQTTVKMYIASADIGGWTNLLLINENGDRVEKDAVAPIFAMYDMIEKSTTVADIDAYMWKAISQVDTYVNALENWRKAAADEVTAAAQETAENANDAVVVPTSVYAAINGAVNYTEVNAYKTNALAEIADIRAYRADIAEQGSELDLIYGTLTEFKNAFDVLDASLTGENNAFDTLLKDVQDAITTAQNAITGGTDESSESLASIKSYLENTIYKAMTDFKADVDTAFDDLGSNLAAYGDVLIALRDALVGDGTDGSVGKIDEILADIADAQSDITNIKTTVGSLATTEDLTTAVTDIKGALTVSEGKITNAITAAQNAITSAIASVRTDIDALETALAGYESDFEGLSGTLAQINSSLGGKIDAAQADIDAIKTAIDALGTPASAAAVTELATAIDELKAAVNEISVSVSAPSAVETVKTEATADIAEWLNAYVDEIVNSVTASNGKAYAAAVTFAPALETTDGDLYAKLLKAFDKDNADLVLKYYNDALTAIDAATTADEVNTAVATFKAQVASVEAASGNTSDLTVVYVLLIVVLVVLVVAVVVAAVLSRKRRVPVGYAPAPTPAPAPATSETTEQTEKAALAEKPEVTDDTAATAVEPDEAPDEDAGERVVINASVKTFDEAYDEMSDTLKDMFEKVREYALSKNGATGVRIGNGVRVKRGSKQIVKLTVRRGYPVAMFVLENEMLKDYRRTAGSSAKLKVPATELVLREPSDLDAAYMMVDLAVRQLDADVEAAKERRRELLRERRRQRREAMEAAKAAQAAQAEATTEQAEPAATEQNEAATPEQAVDEDKTE